jgi:hypothetical protein
MLAGHAENCSSLAQPDLSQEAATSLAILPAATVDIEPLGKVSRLSITPDKIT